MAGTKSGKNWYSRGYLPHWDVPGQVQMIIFRLADSLPAHVMALLEEQKNDSAEAQKARYQHTERTLDAGHGSCWLRDPRIAQIVEQTLLHWDGQRYALLAWVIMQNHVHLLVETWREWPLPDIVHSWKSYTANVANRTLGRRGPFWYREYYDRYIRDENHLEMAVNYIHNNPVKAGLATEPKAWLWSSAASYTNELI